MIPLLVLLLAQAAPDTLVVVEDTIPLAKGQVRAVNLTLKQEQAVIEVDYRVLRGGPEVDVALVGPGMRNSNQQGQDSAYLRLIPGQAAGRFRFPAAVAGDYQVGFDGRRMDTDAELALAVRLRFAEEGLFRPSLLSRGRRHTIVGCSLLFFLAVAYWSGRRILESVRLRPPSSPQPPF